MVGSQLTLCTHINITCICELQLNATRPPIAKTIAVIPQCVLWRQTRPDYRPPTTDYSVASPILSMYALASIANRLPITDHRLLIPDCLHPKRIPIDNVSISLYNGFDYKEIDLVL